jgi:hypothetical protein
LIDNTTNNQSFFGNNKLPEINLRFIKALKYKNSITLNPSLLFGKYEEPQFKRTTTRYQLLLNYSINHIKSKEINWVTTGIFKQNFYDTGKYYSDRNFHASFVNSLNSSFSINKDFLKLNLNYTFNLGKGFAPIFSDFTGNYQNLAINLKLLDNKHYELNLSTNYFITNKSLSPIAINFKYYNEKFYTSIFTTLDKSKIGNINTNIDWYITKDLRLTTWFNYNSFTNKIDYVDFILVKDNHCWVSYLVYRSSIKQLYIYAYLKALPFLGLNLGIDQSTKFIPTINNP